MIEIKNLIAKNESTQSLASTLFPHGLPPQHNGWPVILIPSVRPTYTESEVPVANSAFNKKLKPSQQLSDILGSPQDVSRADAVKGLWEYFKKHDLQNPENRREILADDKLKPLFGKPKITMFEVGKIVNSNLA